MFGLVGKGLATGQIAEQLHLSTRIVETYRERLKTKLNLKHAAELNRDAAQFLLPQSRSRDCLFLNTANRLQHLIPPPQLAIPNQRTCFADRTAYNPHVGSWDN